ncbi:hypothetical protein HOT31_gp116 [Microbacterium phage Hendrix]|uniref:Uncharacterized protein n=1 Tax=Microbacterium phage Hendrix TaxID=2182341 RepID=A0A2U8UUN3_9CAUD|nr:hypothetical protein HOT31_gp116 [Microbacterium phage Hendrix]AWN07787.1 hypothetical protein PBI_HENDRIX_116 [Microbacterium phage Hendrix]
MMSRSKHAPEPGMMFISGVDYHDGERWRLYVNSRWLWKYVLVDQKTAQIAWRALSTLDRLEVAIPEDAEVFQVPVEERWEGPEGEKEAYRRLVEGLAS